MSQMSHSQPTMYMFFYFKIEIKTKADLYMPCKAMAYSPSYIYWACPLGIHGLHLHSIHLLSQGGSNPGI